MLRYYVNSKEVAKDQMLRRVSEVLEGKSQKIVIIKADVDAEYSAVMEAMDALRSAGIEDMGLIVDRKPGTAGAGGGK